MPDLWQQHMADAVRRGGCTLVDAYGSRPGQRGLDALYLVTTDREPTKSDKTIKAYIREEERLRALREARARIAISFAKDEL